MTIAHRLTRAERATGERGLNTQPTDLLAQLTLTAFARPGRPRLGGTDTLYIAGRS